MHHRVGAATTDLTTRAAREDREAEPGLVLEAVALGGIEGQRHARRNARRDRRQAFDAARQGVARVDRAQLRHRAFERTGRLDQRQIFGIDRSNPARVLGVEPLAQCGQRLARQRFAGQRVDEVGQREVDRQPLDARRLQRLDRHADDFHRRRHAVAADQLAADLAHRPARIERRRLELEHLSRIAEPHRPRMVAHPRRGDAADLRGQVRAYGEAALRHRIDEANGIMHRAGLEPRRQLVGELGERRIDLFIAIEAREPQHARLEAGRRIGSRRQSIVKPFGEETSHGRLP